MSLVEFLSQPIFQRFALTLLHFLWQGLAVAILAAIVVKLFRIKHGNARYGAYLLAFVAMIVFPVVTFSLIDVAADSQPDVVIEETPAKEVAATSYAALPATGALPVTEVVTPMEVTANTDFVQATAIPAPVTFTMQMVEEESVPLNERLSAMLDVSMPWVSLVWMLGVIVLSTRLLAGFVGIYRWRSNLKPLTEGLSARVDSLSDRLGMAGFSRVFISPTAIQAMAVGYLKPIVLLPAAMVTQMPADMLEAVIAHELAHIRRFDLWVNLVQRLTETLLFYHPAVWWLSNRLRCERELCCDAMAVKLTGERLTYAKTLQKVTTDRVNKKKPFLATGLGQNTKPTLGRVRHILGLKPHNQNTLTWQAGLIAVLLLAAIAIPTTVALTKRPAETPDLKEEVNKPDSIESSGTGKELLLPGSKMSIEQALGKPHSATVAICRAGMMTSGAGSEGVDYASQIFRVKELLAGGKPKKNPVTIEYRYFNSLGGPERSISVGESIIWVMQKRTGRAGIQYEGIKALQDTPENRQAVLDLLKRREVVTGDSKFAAKLGSGLNFSIEMQPGKFRVGDPVVIDVKIKNTTDKEVNFYYQDLYAAESLIVENQKGEVVNIKRTLVEYDWPLGKEFVRLIKPGKTFTHQIKGRVEYKFLKAEQLRDTASRPLLINFFDVVSHIKDTGKFTARLRLEIGEVAVNRAKMADVDDIWTGTLESNKFAFNVAPMPRKELDKAIDVLRKGSDEEITEAIEILGANADKKAVKMLMETLNVGSNKHMRKAGKALISIQDTSIVPELADMYEKPAPNSKTEREYKFVVMNALKNLESKDKANERFMEVLKSDAPYNEIYYAAEQLALAAYKPALPVMIELAKSTDSRRRRVAITTLQIIGHRLQEKNRKLVVETLLERMKNEPDPVVRKKAVEASARVGGDSVSDDLVEALKDKSVAFIAAIYLGTYGSAEALGPLQEYADKLKDEKSIKVVHEKMKFIRQRTGGAKFNVIEMKWGEAVNGLQLGLLGESKYESLLDRKPMRASYCYPGDLVGFRVFVRNNSDKAVNLVHNGTRGLQPTVLAPRGKSAMQFKTLRRLSRQKQMSLLPGEMKELGPVYLQLSSGPEPDSMRATPQNGFLYFKYSA